MALFGSARDASLIRSTNRELINKYIDTEVEWYQLSLEDTRENLYGESGDKTYYAPVRLNAIIERLELEATADDYGIELARPSTFSFLRDDLVEKNVLPEIGDIFWYNNEYYQVDVVQGGEWWAGKNPATDLGNTTGERGEFGYNVMIRCDVHVTRRNKLNLAKVRSGINNEYDLPKNL